MTEPETDPTDAVEIAARALFKLDDLADPTIYTPNWYETSGTVRHWYRTKARTVAEAITPAIVAAERERIAAAIEATCRVMHDRYDTDPCEECEQHAAIARTPAA